MPRRTDIHKILLIGSGPIIIGQGCEFDYSGTQACKVLRQEGYEVVLINSNPATIMTDPDMADRTYIEPLTAGIVHEIIRRERPDALLPTLGGQTALNLAMELEESGVLKRYNVELIGASAAAIRRAEDRQLFKETMNGLGLDMPRSGAAHTLQEAEAVAGAIGSWPLIIRPGFTLGGTGGGIAHNPEEFADIVCRGLEASLNSEVLIEESLLGWKEFEMEVMTDGAGNSVIVCSIENLDPMGVHTGDSITIAPIQTLSDAEYQAMRDDSLRVLKAIGVQTGGSNVQWAVHPETGRRIIIEMNPRVSRSSALASKATGFPIAKIAALLAVGYTLPELKNDITGHTTSCFEPALDYVVTKIPRFTFEKFPNADSTLGTQMKSVGEVMAIGRNLKQSLQKALRSLETGRSGFGADGKDAAFEQASDAQLQAELARPNDRRLFYIRAAFRRGWSVQLVQELTGIDSYFLRHLAELAAFEDEIASAGSLAGLEADEPLFLQTKELGYSDRQIAYLLNCCEPDVRAARGRIGLQPGYAAVDTCAGEFKALTPYYYSSYHTQGEAPRVAPGKKSIMIIGGGPNRIGQGIEFDYCCCQAAAALRQAGYEVVMVNSNPETVSTDYDTSDKLYFEPLTLEDLLPIYRREQCSGAIVQFGGQTPLNLAQQLKDAGVNIIGTSPDDIDLAEDRDFFKQLTAKVGIRQPESGIAHNVEEALSIAHAIGYPLLVRPSFVLGGRGMVIVYEEKYLREFVGKAAAVAGGKPILIDRFLEMYPAIDGVFLDQLCYQVIDHSHSDGRTAFNDKPAAEYGVSYEYNLTKLADLLHKSNKFIWANGPFDIEIARWCDGVLSEGTSGISETHKYLCLRKPFLVHTYPVDVRKIESMFRYALLAGGSYSYGGSSTLRKPAGQTPEMAKIFAEYKFLADHLLNSEVLLQANPFKLPPDCRGEIFRSRISADRFISLLPETTAEQLTLEVNIEHGKTASFCSNKDHTWQPLEFKGNFLTLPNNAQAYLIKFQAV